MVPIKRKSWDHDAMIRAVNAVRSKQMGYLKASKHFSVPKGTLERYVKKDANAEVLVKIDLGRPPVLPIHLEAELEKYCKELDQRFYGLRLKDIKHMAFQLAIKNNLKHPFSLTKASAGKKWLHGFMSRHPYLKVRTPGAVSTARKKKFNQIAVKNFFDLYEPVIDKIKSPSHRVYNVDEIGITVVQHKRFKVISVKGKKQVKTLTSLERENLITVVTCMNASGSYVPPLIIFPRKNMVQDLMDGAPAGSISDCHPSGWIQTHLFTKWFQHFINYTKPSKDDPIILLLDGHYTHVRNIDVINLAQENNVIIIGLPPHSMQPMNVAFMKPLKAYYSQEIEMWSRNNPGRTLVNKYVTRLFGIAYEKAATMSNSINGFRKTGLVPCNRNIFTENNLGIFNYENQGLSDREVSNKNPEKTLDITFSTENMSNMTEASFDPVALYENSEPSTSSFASPFTFVSVPKLPRNDSSKKTRTGEAFIITGHPYKSSLKESLNKKNERENKTSSKKGLKKAIIKSSQKEKVLKKL